MSEWYRNWFGEEYLALYPHRDDEDARRAVALIAGQLPLQGTPVLDLACGPGRHATWLEHHGARVTGLDLSMVLLQRARAGNPPVRDLVRGDMRTLPFATTSFGLVVNLFTSFGYFNNDDEHLAVLQDVARVLRPGGSLVMDFLNADRVRDSLVASETVSLGGRRVDITRSVSPDTRYVEKTMCLVDEDRSFAERVRLFSADELADLLQEAGLVPTLRFGDYDGAPWGARSPRVILFAARP